MQLLPKSLLQREIRFRSGEGGGKYVNVIVTFILRTDGGNHFVSEISVKIIY